MDRCPGPRCAVPLQYLGLGKTPPPHTPEAQSNLHLHTSTLPNPHCDRCTARACLATRSWMRCGSRRTRWAAAAPRRSSSSSCSSARPTANRCTSRISQVGGRGRESGAVGGDDSSNQPSVVWFRLCCPLPSHMPLPLISRAPAPRLASPCPLPYHTSGPSSVIHLPPPLSLRLSPLILPPPFPHPLQPSCRSWTCSAR